MVQFPLLDLGDIALEVAIVILGRKRTKEQWQLETKARTREGRLGKRFVEMEGVLLREVQQVALLHHQLATWQQDFATAQAACYMSAGPCDSPGGSAGCQE